MRTIRSSLVPMVSAAVVLLFLFNVSLPGFAQEFPTKPIRLLVGFPPGGNADVGARIVAQKMSEGFGRQVLVENRTGGGGVVASTAVAKSPPDGYTLLLMIGGFVTQAATMKKLPYDSLRDFSPISLLMTYPVVIAVSAESPYRTLADLIGYAKNNPSKLNYGAPIGTLYHLVAEMFSSMAGIELTFVPYRGGSEPLTEVVAGRMNVAFEAITTASPQIQGGKLRALAVTSAQPSPALPGVPTALQTLPGFETISFLAIAAPPGMPRPIVNRLNAEIRRILASPDVGQRFADWGGQPAPTSPEEMQRFLELEITKWTKVVQQRNIVLD